MHCLDPQWTLVSGETYIAAKRVPRFAIQCAVPAQIGCTARVNLARGGTWKAVAAARRCEAAVGDLLSSDPQEERKAGEATMAPIKRAGNPLLALVPKTLMPQTTDISAGVLWGTTAVVGAVFLVQPFGWIKEQLFTKEEEKAPEK